MSADVLIACFETTAEAEELRKEKVAADPLTFASAISLVRKSDGKLMCVHMPDPDSVRSDDEVEVPQEFLDDIFPPQTSESSPLKKGEKGLFDIDEMRKGLMKNVVSAMGFDLEVLKQLLEFLQPGRSALIFIVEDGIYKVREQLEGKCSQILQTTINSDVAKLDSVLDQNNDAFARKMIELQVTETKKNLSNKAHDFLDWWKKLFHLKK